MDRFAVLSLALGKKNVVLLRSFGDRSALISGDALYFAMLHARLSTFFYGSGLLFLTCADILNGSSALVYCISVGVNKRFNIMCVAKKPVSSVSSVYANATWYEREVSEFFGLSFINSEDTRTLLMPYNDSSNPLKKQQQTAGTSAILSGRRLAALRWFSI